METQTIETPDRTWTLERLAAMGTGHALTAEQLEAHRQAERRALQRLVQAALQESERW